MSAWSSKYDKGIKIDIDGIKFDITFVSNIMNSKELLWIHYVVLPISKRPLQLYKRESYTIPKLSMAEVYKLLHPMYCIMANKNSANPARTLAIIYQTITMYSHLLMMRVDMCVFVGKHAQILSAEENLNSMNLLTKNQHHDFSFMSKREFTAIYDKAQAMQILASFTEPLYIDSYGDLCMAKYKINTVTITRSMMSCMSVELRELFELVIGTSGARSPSTAKSMKNVIDNGIH